MSAFAVIILALFCIAGFFAVFFNTAGPALIFVGALIFGFMTRFQILNGYELAGLGAAAAIAEILDYALTAVGIKRGGGSKGAMFGAVVGGFLGGFAGTFVMGIGVLPGTLIGIFLGAFMMEFMLRGQVRGALKAGTGAMIGAGSSIFVKLLIALGMVVFLVVRIFKAGMF